jgi:Zn-finger nucleic acid-binding protein
MPVFRCEGCYGYLLARRRMEGIQRVQEKTIAELKRETLAEAQEDSGELIRCPRCRGRMKKEWLKEPAAFHIDSCAGCQLIWFDGGELARLQLSHEISARGQDAAEMQRRHRQMTPQQREQLERDLANLPDPETAVFGGFKEVVIAMFSGPGGRRRW